MSKPEIYGEDEITCPYCQQEISDSWEMGDSGEHTCYNCGKKFEWEQHVSVDYSSIGLEEEEYDKI